MPIFKLNFKRSDMDFIYFGQSVDMRLGAFTFTKYDLISGKVAYIDSNSFSSEKGQLFYKFVRKWLAIIFGSMALLHQQVLVKMCQ